MSSVAWLLHFHHPKSIVEPAEGGSRKTWETRVSGNVTNPLPKVPLILVPSQGGMCVTDAAAERPDTEQQSTSLPLAR